MATADDRSAIFVPGDAGSVIHSPRPTDPRANGSTTVHLSLGDGDGCTARRILSVLLGLLLLGLVVLVVLQVVTWVQKRNGSRQSAALVDRPNLAGGAIQTIQKSSELDALIAQASLRKPLVVKFHATWCPACIAIQPKLLKLATQFQNKVKVAQVEETYITPAMSQRFGITHFPIFLRFIDATTTPTKVVNPSAQELERKVFQGKA